MNKKILGTILFVFSLVFGQVSFADSMDCGKGIRDMVQSLNLDDSQKAKIKPILDQLKSTVNDKATQLDGLRKQISQQVMSANMDQSTVDNLVDQKTKLIGDIIKAKIAATIQIMSVLTDAQKTQLQKKIQDLEEKMAEKYKKCHEDD
ncbi:Spy/CpxP family protein refolding chaperone [Legionella sp.]|uniref:Spy/CpxP family protein refolding chaperone n=1 Tax=Legionella sp. TaxID=459 RepID=UPI00321FA997